MPSITTSSAPGIAFAVASAPLTANERVLSAVNDKGRQVEPAQVFGSVWCGHGSRSWRATP